MTQPYTKDPTPRQVREAKQDELLQRAREYVERLQTGFDPSKALRVLGAAAVEWTQAEARALLSKIPREP